MTGAPCDNGNNNKNLQCADYVTNLGSCCYYYYYTMTRSGSLTLFLSLCFSLCLLLAVASLKFRFVCIEILWETNPLRPSSCLSRGLGRMIFAAFACFSVLVYCELRSASSQLSYFVFANYLLYLFPSLQFLHSVKIRHFFNTADKLIDKTVLQS